MILTDREIVIALDTGQLVIDPRPDLEAITSTAVDLSLKEEGLSWIALDGGFQIRPGHRDYKYSKAAQFQKPIDIQGYTVEPKSFFLGWTREKVKLPNTSRLAARVEGKSSLAGMVSRWSADRFVETLGASSSKSADDARAAIEDHTGAEVSSINNAQRILLIAEDFDPAVLVATEWLHENYGVDIRCYRLQLSQENGSDYLTCTCIYPPIEIATLTRRADRTTPDVRAVAWADWTEALKPVENAAVRDFYNAELAHNQENRLRYRELIYRIDEKRRYWVACRAEYAYVWQRGRFSGDEDFWRKLISKPASVGRRKGVSGGSLRFHLATPADFAAFKKAVLGELKAVEYSPTPDEGPSEGEE